MKLSFKNISKPTPRGMKKLGNNILLLTAGLSTLMMGSPFSAETVLWVNWIINAAGILGKFLTSMTTTEEETRLPEFEGDIK